MKPFEVVKRYTASWTQSPPANGKHSGPIFWRWGSSIAIIVGIAVRLWQYFANPSIWVDEAALARNILDRQPHQLFNSLDYAQVAPPGFLLSIKLSTMLLGASEYALRLIPVAAGIASLILFFFVARTVLRPVASVVATFMFSIAVPLVFFSSNLKQYSSDIAITLIIIIIAIRLFTLTLTSRNAYVFAFIPIPLLFCSQTAVFPLTIAGATLFIDALASQRSDKNYRFAMIVSWAIAALAVAAYSSISLNPVSKIYLFRFWEPAFMPRQGWDTWLWATTKNVFAGQTTSNVLNGSLGYAWPELFATLVVIGSIALLKKHPKNAALVAGPVLLVLLASALYLYPFGNRMIIFLLPLLLLMTVAGADYVGQLVIRSWANEYLSVLLLSFAIAAFLQQPLPRTPEHLRPVMQYVSHHWKQGDVMWVYYGAGQAFEYYKKLIPISGAAQVGTCNRAEPRNYLYQVDVERGHARVWILMAHGSSPFGFDERKLIISYLDTIGLRMDEFHAPGEDNSPNHAVAYLFDLSIQEKLAASSAEQFPIENNYPPKAWTCYGTMSHQGADEKIIRAVMDWNKP